MGTEARGDEGPGPLDRVHPDLTEQDVSLGVHGGGPAVDVEVALPPGGEGEVPELEGAFQEQLQEAATSSHGRFRRS